MAQGTLMLHPARTQRLTLEGLAEAAGFHPELVARLVDYGLVQPVAVEEHLLWFDVAAVRRLQTIRRLREDLGINLPGIAVILDLLDRLAALEREVARLRQPETAATIYIEI